MRVVGEVELPAGIGKFGQGGADKEGDVAGNVGGGPRERRDRLPALTAPPKRTSGTRRRRDASCRGVG